MSSFTKPLILEALQTTNNGRGEFLVHEPFEYEVGYLGSGDKIVIPKGFKTDLCSIPWFARPFIPLSGPYAKPALLHDWLIENDPSRASDIFQEALDVSGINIVLRHILVVSVKIWFKLKNIIKEFR